MLDTPAILGLRICPMYYQEQRLMVDGHLASVRAQRRTPSFPMHVIFQARTAARPRPTASTASQIALIAVTTMTQYDAHCYTADR